MVHFLPQVGVYLWERIPVHRHSGELSLQQNERGGLHQREWNWEGLGCGGLCLSIAGWWLNWPTTLRHMRPSHCMYLPCPNWLIVNLGHIQCTWIQPSEGRNVVLWQQTIKRIYFSQNKDQFRDKSNNLTTSVYLFELQSHCVHPGKTKANNPPKRNSALVDLSWG